MTVLRREERRSERKRERRAVRVCGRVALKRFAAIIGELRNNVHFAAALYAALTRSDAVGAFLLFHALCAPPRGTGGGRKSFRQSNLGAEVGDIANASP